MASVHVCHAKPAATMKSLAKPTNAPALTPTDMKAVTGVGAPSYTSGAQLWKGTAEILKPKPVTTSTSATTSSDARVEALRSGPCRAARRRCRGVVGLRRWPRTRSARPKARIAEEKAPLTKYLIDASPERSSRQM